MTLSNLTFSVPATILGATRYDFPANDDPNRIIKGGRILCFDPKESTDVVGFDITSIACDYVVFEELKSKAKSFPCDAMIFCVQKSTKDKNGRAVTTLYATGIGETGDMFTTQAPKARAK